MPYRLKTISKSVKDYDGNRMIRHVDDLKSIIPSVDFGEEGMYVLRKIDDIPSFQLTLKAPPIICSRRQFQILLLFEKSQIRHDIARESSAGRRFS